MKTSRILITVAASLILGAGLAFAFAGRTPTFPLTPLALNTLKLTEQTPASSGAQIYEGRVLSPAGTGEYLFRYQRRVRADNYGVVSSHLTFDPAGNLVVIQSARHTADYGLVRADLIHGQTGVSGAVDVVGGRVKFSLNEGDQASTAEEELTQPVVAGPTMFGFILAHWDELNAGAVLPIRFALIERMETIGFTLAKVDSAPGRTTIVMTPTSALVRLALAPTYFHFDPKTRHILEYTGRVPPLQNVDGKLQALDARVTYDFVADRFE